MAVAFNNSN